MLTAVALVCVLFALIPARAHAQAAPPQLTTTVNDFANVIDAASEGEMDRRIRALQRASGDVVVVATVPSIEPFGTIDEYAVKMFENGGRGVGQKGKDNGLLIVVAMKERRVRVEVGYDLEEFITDGYAGSVIREVMQPQFASGAFGPGLLDGSTRIINRIAERRGVELTDVPRDRQPVHQPDILKYWPLIVVLWFLIGAISNSRRRGRRRRWGGGPWSGWNSGVGPFGGGMGGFGGGRSGGGGASGSW